MLIYGLTYSLLVHSTVSVLAKDIIRERAALISALSLIMLNAKQKSCKCQFFLKSFGMPRQKNCTQAASLAIARHNLALIT